MILIGMANTVQVKLMLTRGDVEKIDRLVEEGKFASRADFGSKAVFLLLASMDGTQEEIKSMVAGRGVTKT